MLGNDVVTEYDEDVMLVETDVVAVEVLWDVDMIVVVADVDTVILAIAAVIEFVVNGGRVSEELTLM